MKFLICTVDFKRGGSFSSTLKNRLSAVLPFMKALMFSFIQTLLESCGFSLVFILDVVVLCRMGGVVFLVLLVIPDHKSGF